ncbi:MAG: hypothetical protein Kow0099_25860 [Candidatus Abyssubacteria bacterium]
MRKDAELQPSSSRRSPPWEFKAISLVFLVALVLRIIVVLEFRVHDPMFDRSPLALDMHHFQKWITNIVDTNWADREYTPFWQAPLYSYVMAFIVQIFGKDLLWPKLFQALLGSMDCILVYFIGKKVFDARVGIVAALFTCFYGMFIFHHAILLRDGFLTSLYLLSILSLLIAQEKNSARYYLLAGVCFGISLIGRPNTAPFAVPALAWTWLSAGQRQYGKKAALVASFLIGTILAIAPVTAKNYLVGGEFVLINKQGGLMFYIGNCRDATGTLTFTESISKVTPDFVHMSFEELAKIDWTGMAFTEIREDPVRFVRLTFKKLYLFCASYEIPNNVNYYLYRKFSFVLRLPLLPFWVVFPLAVTGMLLSVKSWWPRPALLILFLLTYMVSILLLFVLARYRLSSVPFFIVFAAYAVVWWYDTLRERNYRKLVASLVPLALAGAFSVATRSDYIRPNDYFNLGLAYHTRGQYDEAVRSYRDALSADPHFTPARGNLLSCYLDLGRGNEALALAREGVATEPRSSEAWVGLATVLLASDRTDEAVMHLERAVALDPGNLHPRKMLARLYSEQGKLSRARLEWEKVLSLNPGDPEAIKEMERISPTGTREE